MSPEGVVMFVPALFVGSWNKNTYWRPFVSASVGFSKLNVDAVPAGAVTRMLGPVEIDSEAPAANTAGAAANPPGAYTPS